MTKKDEAFEEYEQALNKIDNAATIAREEARSILREKLVNLRSAKHEELKAIRKIEQGTRGTNGGIR